MFHSTLKWQRYTPYWSKLLRIQTCFGGQHIVLLKQKAKIMKSFPKFQRGKLTILRVVPRTWHQNDWRPVLSTIKMGGLNSILLCLRPYVFEPFSLKCFQSADDKRKVLTVSLWFFRLPWQWELSLLSSLLYTYQYFLSSSLYTYQCFGGIFMPPSSGQKNILPWDSKFLRNIGTNYMA